MRTLYTWVMQKSVNWKDVGSNLVLLLPGKRSLVHSSQFTSITKPKHDLTVSGQETQKLNISGY